jgi:aldose 1-epimerase
MILETNLKEAFQSSIDGNATDIYFLQNQLDTKVGICNYGARITHFIVKNNKGEFIDVVLGFNSLEDYQNANERYHGVTVGPFANRIAAGKFELDGKPYQLEKNNGENSLHGGFIGFHDKVWEVVEVSANSIELTTSTVIGEAGFPGGLTVKIKYTLTDDNELLMDYHAETERNTIINLTNHAYFNLNGEQHGDITKHIVQINAESFVAINNECIPFGKKLVENTPFDFRVAKVIDKDLPVDDEQLIAGGGYDHSFELKEKVNDQLIFAASAQGDKSGLKLEVFTTEPAIQFYSGNFLMGNDKGKSDVYYVKRSGFCLETQHHPDAPNHPDFHSTLLKAGEVFSSKTIYKIIA